MGTRRRPQEFEISVRSTRPGPLLGPCSGSLGPSLGRLLLGPSWGPLGLFWGPLGGFWGRLAWSDLGDPFDRLAWALLRPKRKANKHAEHYLFIAFSLYAFDDLCLLRPSRRSSGSTLGPSWTPLSWAGLKPSWTVAGLSWPVSTLSWTVSALRSGPLGPSWLELFGGSGEPPGCVGELVRPPP